VPMTNNSIMVAAGTDTGSKMVERGNLLIKSDVIKLMQRY